VALALQGREVEAKARLKSAARLAPRSAWPLCLAAAVARRAGRPEEVLGIINSEQPTSALADRYMQKLSAPDPTGAVKAQLMNDLRRQAHDDASMRSFLFAMLVSDSVEREGPNLLILGIAADRVAVFKETPLFLLIRYTPPSLLAEVAQIEGEDEPSE